MTDIPQIVPDFRDVTRYRVADLGEPAKVTVLGFLALSGLPPVVELAAHDEARGDRVSLYLSPREARNIAALLVAQAEAAER